MAVLHRDAKDSALRGWAEVPPIADRIPGDRVGRDADNFSDGVKDRCIVIVLRRTAIGLLLAIRELTQPVSMMHTCAHAGENIKRGPGWRGR